MIGNDLTKGNLARTLLRFTLPFLIANVLHSLYGIVDIYIVGKFSLGTELSAVSVGSGLMLFMNLLIMGFGTGATILVGQMAGAHRESELRETIATVFTFFPLLGLLLLLPAFLFSPQLLALVNVPPEAAASALRYLRICLIGLIFTSFFTAIASSLRGMGDSKGPTIFVGLSCVLNIIGDAVLVGALQLGAAGAAIATSAAQGVSVVAGVIYLRRRTFPFDFHPSSFRFYRGRLGSLLRMGIPTALQETLTNASFLVLEAIINNFGYEASAAAGVCDRLFSISIIPAVAFSSAISAMVAQNTGAGEFRRSRQSLRLGMGVGFAMATLIFLAFQFAPAQIIGQFSHEAEIVRNGVAYIYYYKYDMLLCTLAFCIGGYINGTGHTRYTMVMNLLASFAVRLPLIWIIGNQPGVTLYEIGFSMPVATVVQIAIGLGFLLFAKSERALRRTQKHAEN